MHEDYEDIRGNPIDLYLQERSISTDEHGTSASEKLLRAFQQWLGEHGLNMYSFQVAHVRQYYEQKVDSGKWQQSSAETFVNYVKGFCKWLTDYTLTESGNNRIGRIRKMRVKSQAVLQIKKRLVAPRYLDLLRLAYKRSPTNDFPRFWLIGYLGVRVGELVKITAKNLLYDGEQTDNIDIPSNAVWTPTEKQMSGLIRLLFYDDFTKDIWKQAQFRCGRGWNKGMYKVNVETQQIRNRMKAYDKELDMHCHPHQLRKCFNTRMKAVVLNNSDEIYERFGIPADDTLVKIMMGHTAGFSDMTRLYTQYEPSVFKYLMAEKHYMREWEEEFRDWKK